MHGECDHPFPADETHLMEVKDRSAQVFTSPTKPNPLAVQTFEENGLIDLPFDLVLVC
jgi:hypothetical protein